MKAAFNRTQTFFFAPRSATGWGLMRISWGLLAFCSMLFQWVDVTNYYSNAGYLPSELQSVVLRSVWRYSLLDVVTDPTAVFALYLLLLALLLCVTVGWKTRWTTIASVLLLFTFHERNPLPLGGGDTVLRLLGFLLMISPGIYALSLDRIAPQWRHWREKGTLSKPLTMPSWPYRLLLWQLIVLYGMSLWNKLLGTMWVQGTAVTTALHHPQFSAVWNTHADALAALSPIFGWLVLVFHVLWLLLLIPQKLLARLGINKRYLKRWILFLGILFHLSIFIFLYTGILSMAMLTAYLGLLDGDDLEAIRGWWNKRRRGKITVLHDAQCGLCKRSAFVLALMDSLKRLKFVDIHNEKARKTAAPEVTMADLNKALHIRLPNKKTFKAFRALRILARHLPILWPILPFFYLPGVRPVGEHVYAKVAAKRKRCTHKNCA